MSNENGERKDPQDEEKRRRVPPEESAWRSRPSRPDPSRREARAEARPRSGGDDEDVIDEMPERFLESLIGEDHLPSGRKDSFQFWASTARALWHIVHPKSNLRTFIVGFWVLRLVGALVLASWAYFGVAAASWDPTKLAAGIVIILLGPITLRGAQFIFETFLLSSFSSSSWRDFWNFRRMMTPRSIQFAFFIGFWLLVGSGLVTVARGFVELIQMPTLEESVGNVGDFRQLVSEMLNDPSLFEEDILDALSLARRALKAQEAEGGATAGASLPPGIPTPGSQNDQPGGPAAPPAPGDPPPGRTAASDPGATATLTSARGEDTAELIWRILFQDRTREKNPIRKIIKGFLFTIFAPLAFRFTCEWIILIFRINDTLTDISRELESLRRREDGDEEDENSTNGNGGES